MRGLARYILMISLLLMSGMIARAQNRNNLITTGDDLVLLIDISSPVNDIDSILKHAAIKNTNGKKVAEGDFSAIVNDGWMLTAHEGNVVQFNRPLIELKNNPPASPFVITGDMIKVKMKSGYMGNALYGENHFSTVSVYELPSGLTRFTLPGFLDAKRVFLAGGFNDWSTLKGKMAKTATGWQLDIKLDAGAWMYKFIVDGRWMTDPNNYIHNEADNDNAVYYKYNYIFKLKVYGAAHRVIVAGNFNQWQTDELYLEKKGDVWQIPVYLHEGAHSYRFMVDGKWMPDPANPETEKDEQGNINSILRIGETVYFKLDGHENAKKVFVAGNFNNWQGDKIKLKKTADGWAIAMVLPAGNYDYRFIVDGDWFPDPLNPCQVVEDGKVNSFVAVKPTHVFKLKGHGDAKKIVLSGSFNEWDEQGYTMAHNGDEWTISLHLEPGKYLYKFIVDGNWMIDPGNKLFEDNQYHTGNSVLWIEP